MYVEQVGGADVISAPLANPPPHLTGAPGLIGQTLESVHSKTDPTN